MNIGYSELRSFTSRGYAVSQITLRRVNYGQRTLHHYKDLKKFFTISEVCKLFDMEKSELRRKYEKHDIQPRRNRNGEHGFVKYEDSGQGDEHPYCSNCYQRSFYNVSIHDYYYKPRPSSTEKGRGFWRGAGERRSRRRL